MTNTEIPIDTAALQQKIDTDPVIAELGEKIKEWNEKQDQKKAEYAAKIEAKQDEIKEVNKQITELRRQIKAKRGEIARFKWLGKYRRDGIVRIERRIRARKNFLKRQEVRKATALARKRVAKLLSL